MLQTEPSSSNQDYANVARLIELHAQASPATKNLQSLAQHIGLSEFQVQRLFSRWAGISPKRFAQYLTVQDIRARLNEQPSLLDLSLDAGLSSSSQVHDHFVHFYAMSPKQVREHGSGINIRYGFYPSPFGEVHIATTDKGICWLAFIDPVSRQQALNQLVEEWPMAKLEEVTGYHQELVASLFTAAAHRKPLFLNIKGTNFQLRVWEALLKIPAAHCSSYADIAKHIGSPQAARAIGTAIGHNPVSWLIPCHRVIRSTGVVGDYRWGHTRKASLLAWEQSTCRR